MKSFKLSIKGGNAAAQTRSDVVYMLEQVAAKLREGVNAGNVRDTNGNTVGTFELK